MDLAKVLQQLHEELENLDAAIASLERLQEASQHRSREQALLSQVTVPVRAGRKRKVKAKASGEIQQTEDDGSAAEG
jgi:hypothetical protein